MATKLANYDFSKNSTLTLSDRATYPWDEWLDGNIWKLTVNEDFTTHPLMMERIIRTRATAKRAKVQLRHVGTDGDIFGVIVIRRSDVEAPSKEVATSEPANIVEADIAPMLAGGDDTWW